MENMKIFIKSCPRCGGSRFQDRDTYGWFIDCLACGYMTYPTVGENEPVRFSGPIDSSDDSRVAVATQSG